MREGFAKGGGQMTFNVGCHNHESACAVKDYALKMFGKKTDVSIMDPADVHPSWGPKPSSEFSWAVVVTPWFDEGCERARGMLIGYRDCFEGE